MSRTTRNRSSFSVNRGMARRSNRPHKSAAYLADQHKGLRKIEPTLGRRTGISKLGKLVAKNANRSRKKAARQQSRRVIQQALLQD